MKIQWSFSAEQDIDAALSLDRRFDEIGDMLSQFPYSGRIGKVHGTREFVAHENYILVYSIHDALLHVAQQYPPFETYLTGGCLTGYDVGLTKEIAMAQELTENEDFAQDYQDVVDGVWRLLPPLNMKHGFGERLKRASKPTGKVASSLKRKKPVGW